MSSQLETFGDVIDEVLNYGFADGPQVNKARIGRWVNEAQFQIAREVEGPEFQATETVTMTQGKYKYTLPADFLRMQDVYYPELWTRLRPLDLQQFDRFATTVEGPPTGYTLYATDLWLHPTPYNNDKIELRYIKNAPLLKEEFDVPLLSKNYLHLLVGYAAARAFAAEDDPEMSAQHLNRYKQDLAAYATDVQTRMVDRPKQVDGTWSGGHLL